MKKFLSYFLILALVPVLLLSSCKKDEEETPAEPKGTFADLKSYMEINNYDLPALTAPGWVVAPKMVADGGIVEADYTIPSYHVFDIRAAEDFNAGHIKGSMNVPLGDILTTAVDYTDKPILVVCYTGQTAGRGAMALRLSGYEAAVMKFGFSYWSSDTYADGDKSFDKWTPNVSDQAVGDANWVTSAAPTIPEFEYPTWESTSTDGATILAERVDAMIAISGWGMSGGTVLADPLGYNIYNFWSEPHYLSFGHYDGANQILPISLANDVVKAFNPDEENLVYCYTGQTSSYTTAWLQVLGYPTKSIGFGVNGLSHTALEDDPTPLGGVWHHSLEYEYETTSK